MKIAVMLAGLIAFESNSFAMTKEMLEEMRAFREGSQAMALPENTDAVKVENGGQLVYRLPVGSSKGVAAKIIQVERKDNELVISTSVSLSATVIPYFTRQGAEGALREVVKGSSLFLAGCLLPDQFINSFREASNYSGCPVSVYTAVVDCSRFSSVPVMGSVNEADYVQQDVATDRLTVTRRQSCREHY